MYKCICTLICMVYMYLAFALGNIESRVQLNPSILFEVFRSQQRVDACCEQHVARTLPIAGFPTGWPSYESSIVCACACVRYCVRVRLPVLGPLLTMHVKISLGYTRAHTHTHGLTPHTHRQRTTPPTPTDTQTHTKRTTPQPPKRTPPTNT